MLALLHTSPAHIPVFDALRDEDHQGLELRHFVDEELLARARREGPEAVAEAVRDALDEAVAAGARAVLCTCSTIGAVAERAGARIGVPVLRADRPMAAAAVAAGPRVVVAATLESTLGPTVALVEEEGRRRVGPGSHEPVASREPRAAMASREFLAPRESIASREPRAPMALREPLASIALRASREPGAPMASRELLVSRESIAPHEPHEPRAPFAPLDIRTLLVEGAWARFEAGDTEGCARLVADAVDAVTGADAIILAQGSMAPAQRLTTTAVPVLSSPRLGLTAGARAARAG